MKKSILLLAAAVMICVSCYDNSTHSNDSASCIVTETPYVYTKQTLLSRSNYTYGQISSIRHFTYNGHNYIQFRVYGTDSFGCGIVHDPDCPCFGKADSTDIK